MPFTPLNSVKESLIFTVDKTQLKEMKLFAQGPIASKRKN